MPVAIRAITRLQDADDIARGTAGAGTEASPYTHADATGGIQSCIGAVAAVRGGLALLGPFRYAITAADGIRISTPAINLLGQGGFNVEPNGEAEGITGTKIKTTTHGVRLGTPGGKLGAILLRNLYIYGPGKLGGAQGITIDYDVDQPHIENVMISQMQYGIYISSVSDAMHLSHCSVLNAGYGLYVTAGATISYSEFSDNCIADCDNSGVFFGLNAATNNRWARIVNSSFVRNARVLTTNGANLYIGSNENVICNNIIRDAGHYSIGGTYVVADGVILAGDRNIVNGNQILDNTTGAGIRISGDYNVVYGNQLSGNLYDIVIEAGATGNIIDAPGATITDGGTGTIIVQSSSAPAYVSAEIGDVDESTVVVTFSQAVKAANLATGVAIEVNSVPATISNATRQTNRAVVHYALSAPVESGDDVTWEYDSGAGYITDANGIALRETAAQFVTNNIAGAAPAPPSTNLWARFDFSDVTALFSDDGSTQISADGTAIYRVNDKSGAAHHARQATLGNRPLYKTAIQNALSVARFDNTGQDYLTTGAQTLAQPLYIALVGVSRQAPGTGQYERLAGSSNDGLEILSWGGDPQVISAFAGTQLATGTAVSDGAKFLIRAKFNGASSEISINGAEYTTGQAGATSPADILIGNGGSTFANGLQCDICELVVYAAIPSPGDDADVLSYLNSKWAVY